MLLKISNLQKNYKDFGLDCSLEAEEGRVTGLIGANGAGKSTTFKAVLGLIWPDGGTIELFGKDLSDITPEDKRRIGTVMSESCFNMMLTVNDIIAIMGAMYPKFDKECFRNKCSHYKLPFDKQIKEFSTGMKAKLKVLAAMSYDAQLLILDEPTVGLDYMTRNELIDEMREFMEEEGKAILLSSHISEDLEGICDDVYFLHQGKILLHEDTDKILSEYGVLKVSEEQYQALDKRHISHQIKTAFGYELLTSEKQYYMDNYRELVIEKGSIDLLTMFLTKGETV